MHDSFCLREPAVDRYQAIFENVVSHKCLKLTYDLYLYQESHLLQAVNGTAESGNIPENIIDQHVLVAVGHVIMKSLLLFSQISSFLPPQMCLFERF